MLIWSWCSMVPSDSSLQTRSLELKHSSLMSGRDDGKKHSRWVSIIYSLWISIFSATFILACFANILHSVSFHWILVSRYPHIPSPHPPMIYSSLSLFRLLQGCINNFWRNVICFGVWCALFCRWASLLSCSIALTRSCSREANDAATSSTMRTLLYQLAHRLVGASPTPSYNNTDRFYLHLYILRELQLFNEAHALLNSDVGKFICSTSLVCDGIRRDIWRLQGLSTKEGELAEKRILHDKLGFSPNWPMQFHVIKIFNSRDRNWLQFMSMIDAAVSLVPHGEVSSSIQSDEMQIKCSEPIRHARQLFLRVAEEDGVKDRSGLLAGLELGRRSKLHGLSLGLSFVALLTLLPDFIPAFQSHHHSLIWCRITSGKLGRKLAVSKTWNHTCKWTPMN